MGSTIMWLGNVIFDLSYGESVISGGVQSVLGHDILPNHFPKVINGCAYLTFCHLGQVLGAGAGASHKWVPSKVSFWATVVSATYAHPSAAHRAALSPL